MNNKQLLEKLEAEKRLEHNEWVTLLSSFDEREACYAAEKARNIAQRVFGKKVYFRGIVEFSNICKNDCFYCGIRRSNSEVSRYRLTKEEIMLCCEEGYENGFRTFVLQGGE
ncbi:MAG: [Clostridia bacterium]|nr:[FeFe] hydrogenase H-cluster radical SAM maturase HydE [Clostridia bacterium]